MVYLSLTSYFEILPLIDIIWLGVICWYLLAISRNDLGSLSLMFAPFFIVTSLGLPLLGAPLYLIFTSVILAIFLGFIAIGELKGWNMII